MSKTVDNNPGYFARARTYPRDTSLNNHDFNSFFSISLTYCDVHNSRQMGRQLGPHTTPVFFEAHDPNVTHQKAD